MNAWELRDGARDTKQALALIAGRVGELTEMSGSDDKWNEVEEYARAKGVPFSAELAKACASDIASRIDGWASSNCY